jgi:anti-anti-sigma factor
MLKVHTMNRGSVAILCLEGRIVCGETEALRNAAVSQAGISVLILDFTRVNTVDAAGLGVLLELRQQAESKGIDFRLRNVTRLVGRVLEITRLDSVFAVASATTVMTSSPFGRPISRAFASCA